MNRPLFPTTLSIPSYDIGLRTYQHPLVSRMTAGFRREIDENCALLGLYGATTDSGILCLFSAYTTAIFVNLRS